MKREWIIALILLIGTIGLYGSLSLMEDPAAATFPRVVIIIMGILSLALLLQSALTAGQKSERRVLQSDRVNAKKDADRANLFPWWTLCGCFLIIAVYFTVMEWLGFYVSGLLFFIAATFTLGRKDLTIRKGGMQVGIAFIFMTVLYILFSKLLAVQTPKGLLF